MLERKFTWRNPPDNKSTRRLNKSTCLARARSQRKLDVVRAAVVVCLTIGELENSNVQCHSGNPSDYSLVQ